MIKQSKINEVKACNKSHNILEPRKWKFRDSTSQYKGRQDIRKKKISTKICIILFIDLPHFQPKKKRNNQKERDRKKGILQIISFKYLYYIQMSK